jgi:two-component system, chemotaxis family, chemotaxis protein CheY
MGHGLILVVDDDSDLREVLADVLHDEGYRVLTASGAREALRLLEQGARPDLILLDMMMPEMDGRQFRTEQLKYQEWAAIPTIVFSAYGNLAEVAASLGAAGYLSKPLRMDTLMEALERHLRRDETHVTP